MPKLQERQERLRLRNIAIKKQYKRLHIKHPQWREDAIIKEVAATFFLATRTIEAILRGEGNY